jgi:hypothetical protein
MKIRSESKHQMFPLREERKEERVLRFKECLFYVVNVPVTEILYFI